MVEPIEHPKVFISYAWRDKNYQDKVIAFANELLENHIDVILDKYDLKEGQNTYAFMEKSVSDKSVTNVLLLIDPAYEQKANERKGGVGTETQIISPEVYERTDQTKFLPVIFERHYDGSIPKPHYLKSTLHFDLSQTDGYHKELRRLIKRLYGREEYIKPQLGKKPEWLDEVIEPKEIVRITQYTEIRNIANNEDRHLKFKEECVGLKKSIIDYSSSKNDCLSVYQGLQSLKRDFLSLIKLIPYVPKSINLIADTFESILEEYENRTGVPETIKLSLLHELFIYVIAFCLKNKAYDCVGFLLNRTYHSKNNLHNLESFKVFYCYNEYLNEAVNRRDGRFYFSGAAVYWMDTLVSDFCSKEEFVFADLLCYNISSFVKNGFWFPLTYTFDMQDNRSLIYKFFMELKSRDRLESLVVIFGCKTISEFEDLFKQVSANEEIIENARAVRFSAAFSSPLSIFDTIKMSEIGK